MTGCLRLRSEWAYLADVAADILAKRTAAYPARVAEGRMHEADAASGIAIMTAIANDWRIAAGGGRPAWVPTSARLARIETLRTARDRAAALADRAATALRAQLPRYAALPDRNVVLNDHAMGAPLEPTTAAWIRAADYADAVAAMLWWEEGKDGRLSIVCAINADWRAERAAQEQAQAA